MKVLHLVHAYYPAIGGSEYLVQQISEYLANQWQDDTLVFTTFAYNSSLFTRRKSMPMPAGRARESLNKVEIKRFPVINSFARFLYFAQHVFYHLHLPGNGILRRLYYGPISPMMKKAVRKYTGDIIVSAPFPLNHMKYAFENEKNLPVILIGCAHTHDKHGFLNPCNIELIKKAQGYVALSRHEKRFLVENYGIDPGKIKVLGVGIPALPHDTNSPVTNIDPVIAYIGQHGLHKGIDTLIRSMPEVWKDHPQARLIIAGGTTPFTPSFQQLARKVMGKCQKDEGIQILGNISEKEKSEIINGCHIFASPSGFESFGITILEAWRAKKPVVACDIEVTRGLISNGKTGLLVEYQNPGDLAVALSKLLNNQDLREKLAKNGYREFSENYTWDVVYGKYREFYRSIAEIGKNGKGN